MRIWILTSEFPPQDTGGIGTYARNAATMFSSAGHEVMVLTPSSRAADSLEAERLRVVRFVPRRVHLDEYVPSGTPPNEHPAFPFTCMSYWPALSYQFADEMVRCIECHGPPDIIEAQDYNAIGFYQPCVQEPFDYYHDGGLDQYGISYSLLSEYKPSADNAFDPTLYKRLWMVFAHHRIPNSDYGLIRAYLDQHFMPVLDRRLQGNVELVLFCAVDRQMAKSSGFSLFEASTVRVLRSDIDPFRSDWANA